jgi:hypothetical protein
MKHFREIPLLETFDYDEREFAEFATSTFDMMCDEQTAFDDTVRRNHAREFNIHHIRA